MSTHSSNATPSPPQVGGQLSFFEKYLTVWVVLCILGGIALGKLFPGVAVTLDDPAGEPIETFRRVRDEIKQRVVLLIDALA